MQFWELTVSASEETSEGLTNFLWEQGALGVVEEQVPDEPARLRAFFPDTASSTRLLASVSEYVADLVALGLPVAMNDPAIAPLRDEAWASAWQQSFPPREIGERLLVIPPWEVAPAAGAAGEASPQWRIRVIIEPGRAFGTGHHGSTEGCLVLLDEAFASPPPARVLDIGTGTGILAVAAVKLGAARALGIDVDPDAIAAARGNAERNGCSGRIELALTGPESLAAGAPFSLLLANLLGHTHLALAEHYRRLTGAGGSLILGGVLADEDVGVTKAMEASGFALVSRRVVDGWSSLLLERVGGVEAPKRPAQRGLR